MNNILLSGLSNSSVIILPALTAGLIILLTHIPLGMEVLKRGIVFIDLAIAQMASLGVILAVFIGFEPHSWQTQLCALFIALLAGLGLSLLEKQSAQWQEALIGILFILSASLGVILLSGNPHGGEALQELLVGQILWVTPTQLLWQGGIHLFLSGILLFQIWRHHLLSSWLFHTIFAMAITFSVQLIGVYLVFSSLIMPTLATLIFQKQVKKRLLSAYGLGALSYLVGLSISVFLDWPAGALIVWVMAGICLLFFMFYTAKNRFLNQKKRKDQIN